MNVAVNKPAKSFLRTKFENWYADQIMEQLKVEFQIPSCNLLIFQWHGSKNSVGNGWSKCMITLLLIPSSL